MTLLIKPINQFTVQKTDTPDGSFFGFDWWDGSDWQTVKILAEDLAAALTANIENFVTADLEGVADRVHDFNNFKLAIIKAGQIRLETGSAPPSGQPSVKLVGYGNTASDISFVFENALGEVLKVLGDKQTHLSGKVYVNTTGYTGGLFQMELAGTNGIASFTTGTSFAASSSGGTAITASGAVKGLQASSVNGISVESSVTGTGTALNAKTATGLAARIEGQSIFEEFGAAGSVDPSALVELKSIQKGFLIPRMTTSEIASIGSPATALQVFNLDRNRHEVYNGSYFQGLENRFLHILHSQWATPVNGQTVAFGASAGLPISASSSPRPYEIILRGNGVIRGCDFDSYASGTVGTNQAWSLYIRINNTTDYLVATVSTAVAVRQFSNQSLNIPYVDGDTLRMVFVNPTWTTPPTQVTGGGFLKLQ